MTFESSKRFNSLLVNLSDKINLKRSIKYVALADLGIYYTWKNIEKSYSKNKFKISAQRGTKNLNFLTYHILYQMVKIISSISSKNMKQ